MFMLIQFNLFLLTAGSGFYLWHILYMVDEMQANGERKRSKFFFSFLVTII